MFKSTSFLLLSLWEYQSYDCSTVGNAIWALLYAMHISFEHFICGSKSMFWNLSGFERLISHFGESSLVSRNKNVCIDISWMRMFVVKCRSNEWEACTVCWSWKLQKFHSTFVCLLWKSDYDIGRHLRLFECLTRRTAIFQVGSRSVCTSDYYSLFFLYNGPHKLPNPISKCSNGFPSN